MPKRFMGAVLCHARCARGLRLAAGTITAGCVLSVLLAAPASAAPMPSAPSPVPPAPPVHAPGPPVHAPGPPVRSPGPPVAVPPIIIVVRLGSAFSPATVWLGVGQQFELEVNSSVEATGPGIPSACPRGVPGWPGSGTPTWVEDGMLSVRCAGNGSYLYTAVRAGSAVLTALVRPRCAPGAMCPQWITVADLKITVIP
jgi:hypothetical protein